jgi:hypothetical protein
MTKKNSPALAGNVAYDPHNLRILQRGRSLLLAVHHSLYEAARIAIGPFAALEKSTERIHT